MVFGELPGPDWDSVVGLSAFIWFPLLVFPVWPLVAAFWEYTDSLDNPATSRRLMVAAGSLTVLGGVLLVSVSVSPELALFVVLFGAAVTTFALLYRVVSARLL
jgi:hypothetical protein